MASSNHHHPSSSSKLKLGRGVPPPPPLHVHIDCSKGVTIPSLWEACLEAIYQLESSSYISMTTPTTSNGGEDEHENTNDEWVTTLGDTIQSQVAQVFSSSLPLPLEGFTLEEEEDDHEESSHHPPQIQMTSFDMIEQMVTKASSMTLSSSSSHDTIMPLSIQNSILKVFKVWSIAYDTTTPQKRRKRNVPRRPPHTTPTEKETNSTNATTTTTTSTASSRKIFSLQDAKGIAAILWILQECIGITSCSCSSLPLELGLSTRRRSCTSFPSSSSSDKDDSSTYASTTTMVVTHLLKGMTTSIVNPTDNPRETFSSNVTPAAVALLRVLTNTNKVVPTSSSLPDDHHHTPPPTVTRENDEDYVYQPQMPPSSFVPLAIGVGENATTTASDTDSGVVQGERTTTTPMADNSSSSSQPLPLLHLIIGQDLSSSSSSSMSTTDFKPLPISSIPVVGVESSVSPTHMSTASSNRQKHDVGVNDDNNNTPTSNPTTHIRPSSMAITDNNNNNIHWKINTLTQLEANLDDTTPEVLAYVIETLLKKGGAVDAWVTPIVMKKGRPAHTLHCLVREEDEEEPPNKNNETHTSPRTATTTDKVLEIIFRQTTTLGIRIQRGIERAALRREFISIPIPYVKNNTTTRHCQDKVVDVKVGYLGKDVVSVKAEFDHCREIAQQQDEEEEEHPPNNITLTQIRQYAERQVWDKLLLSPPLSTSPQVGNTPHHRSQEDSLTTLSSSLHELKVREDEHEQQVNADIITAEHSNLPTSSNKSRGTPLKDFDLYGWKPNPSLSDDENYMDILLLITRSSKCRQGSMACLLVQPSTNKKYGTPEETEEELDSRLNNHILSAATNQPLFSENDSDVHAEIVALGCTTQSGLSTLGCTAYITMPPCKRCFGALYAAGIVRIVTRSQIKEPVLEKAAQLNGIQMVTCATDKEQMGRINALVRNELSADARNDIVKERLLRKEERKLHKAKRK